MSKTLEKISRLERELRALKLLLKPKIDFNIDEKIWRQLKGDLKESRKKIYKKFYGR
jgi:hypothetical protein